MPEAESRRERVRQVKGLTIRHSDDAVKRVEKRSTTLELLASSGSIEVSRQRIEAGRHFYLYAADEWTGFELVYVMSGSLTIEDETGREGELAALHPGDYFHHHGLSEKVYCRVGEEAELLLVSSAPSFDLARDGVEEMTAIAQAVEEKDSATQGHCGRIGRLAIRTAELLSLRGQVLIDISYAAYLHDIGKVRVPDHILGKEGALTDEEWVEMKRHPEYGAEILREKAFLGGAAEIVKAHHERFDGSGYPAGLTGGEIPIGARIIAVVDTYDAMTSDRPYKKALSKQAAMEELCANSGTQFDPEVVDAFIQVVEEDDAP